MSVWFLAFIIVLFFEGAMLAVAPQAWQNLMREMTRLPPERIRRIGLSMTIIAIVLLFLSKWVS